MQKDSALRSSILECEDVTSRFQIASSCGLGGFAEVFHVTPRLSREENKVLLASGKRFVIKVFRPEKYADEISRKLIDAECENSIDVSKQGHQNLVNSYEAISIQLKDGRQTRVLVQERCSGSLKSYIESNYNDGAGGLEPEELLNLVQGAMTGIQHLHQRGWVHGDLKPDNILLHRENHRIPLVHMTPKVGDFTMIFNKNSGIEFPPMLKPNRYTSPEKSDFAQQANADRSTASREPEFQDDVYALGVIIEELCKLNENCPRLISAMGSLMSHKDLSLRPKQVDEDLVKPISSPDARVIPVLRSGRGISDRSKSLKFDLDWIDIDWIWCPRGLFRGGPNQRTIVLTSDFWIGAHPITCGQWIKVMKELPRGLPRKTNLKEPVRFVTWDLAISFCKELSKELAAHICLPSEAQWEYACRAGTTSNGPSDLGSQAWFQGNSGNKVHPAGTKAKNEWGIYDMLGNVYEWCNDVDGDNNDRITFDPQGQLETHVYTRYTRRVMKGGCYFSRPNACSPASRNSATPDFSANHIGFRVICSDNA